MNKEVVGAVTRTTAACCALKSAYSEAIKSLILQSSDVFDIPTNEGQSITSEVLTFVDNSSGGVDDVGYVKNPIATENATLNTSLEHFLSRPTLIDTRSWTTASVNGILGSTIEPWYLFLNNAVIKNKLQNYAYLRAKLCIKIVINATPFHYGCVRAVYEPSVNAAGTGDRGSKVRTNAVSTLPYIIPFSQLPGTWLLPADDSGGEIHVPFFRYNNWLPLTSAAAAKTMGTLQFYIAFPLSVASASGSTAITIDTFAWLEDVELNGSTAELTLQAKDEYDGPISRVATAVASVTRRVESVPVIGKFARATTIGASAIADIAGMFGFTNTPVIADVHSMVPVPGVHLASSEISTPVQKLSLDPKQELSIDPTLHGLGNEDEMSIKYISSKKSALVMDGWSTSDVAGTVLFNARVTPALFGSVSIVDAGVVERALRIYHTPLSYLNMMFTHWRGDIVFEINVICTKFHKGRLKISWDPLCNTGGTALSENTVFTTILDIGENNKATFRVPFHSAYPFLRTRGISQTNWQAGNNQTINDLFDNGQFLISVLTPLMSPVSPQNIGVLISVSGAENFEFANPRPCLGENSSSSPPSFFAVQAKDELDTEAQVVTFGDDGGAHPNRYDLNFGERIVSLRALLHRYSLYDTSCLDRQSATRCSLYAKSYSRLPPMFGFDPNGKSTANKALVVGTANFNFTPTHPLTYVSMMYGSFRGSVNYIANASCDLYPYIGDIRVQRITDSTRNGDRVGTQTAGINTATTKSAFLRFLNFSVPAHGDAGAAFTNTQTNGSLNWNYPMMSSVNWNFADATYSNNGNVYDQTDRECVLMEAYVKQATANTVTDSVTFNTYAGTGPDFTCLWWLCCPTLDYYSAIPTAP